VERIDLGEGGSWGEKFKKTIMNLSLSQGPTRGVDGQQEVKIFARGEGLFLLGRKGRGGNTEGVRERKKGKDFRSGCTKMGTQNKKNPRPTKKKKKKEPKKKTQNRHKKKKKKKKKKTPKPPKKKPKPKPTTSKRFGGLSRGGGNKHENLRKVRT